MYIVLRDIAPASNGLPVVHCAPEHVITDLLIQKYGDNYQPTDYDPSLYSWVPKPVRKVDLTRPLDYFQPQTVQGFVHSHVLEHIPADLHRTIRDMNTAIAPGGFHTFCVPFFSRYYREDMDPGMANSERERLFGQFDHVRSFGKIDAPDRLLSLFEGFDQVDLSSVWSPGDLEALAIPPGSATAIRSHSIFHFVKR